MSPKIYILFYKIIFCGLLPWSRAEVFTAITDCEPLLDTYKLVIDDLERYIEKEEKRLTALRRDLEMYRKEYIEAMKDVPNYLGNPINAFTLIKRLTTDIDDIEEMANKKTHFIRNNETARYPNSEDLFGAANALRRLQDTYKLQVNELAEGMINGVTYSNPMVAGDCFELGRVLYELGDFKSAIAWMMKALAKYENEQSDAYSLISVNIFDHISWAYYKIGDFHNALLWVKKFIAVQPYHARAQANLKLFEQNIAEGLVGKINDELDVFQKEGVRDVEDYEKYEELCRGEFETAPEIVKKLKCFYVTETHPFLRLAPIKAEQYYGDPEVLVFYDVISDREIEHVKALAKPNFKRAKVLSSKTGESVPVKYRISKSAFLWDDEVTEVISQRITDFTGLSMETAERLQVVNYGIGGHYVPHYDQSLGSDLNSFDEEEGNRIATVLFYMSEVAQGGATVFTKLGLSVFPIKNAALFWMNLHPSGESDLSTLHAGCPVLRGSKWVSNKWIHAVGQEFLKPCSLEYQSEGIARQHPRPIRKTSKPL